MEKLTFTGFLLRAAFALALVLLTYNPSGYSYAHMLQTGFPAVTPLEAVWVSCCSSAGSCSCARR